MTTIKLAFRKLFQKGEYTLTRIITLAAGLTFTIILLSEVLYYYSYDSFYPDVDRIYIVHENFKMDKNSKKLESYSRVSGAIAPGLKDEVAGIEAATRLNYLGNSIFYTDNQKSYKGRFSLADENIFEVMPRIEMYGDAHEILSQPMQCMVSDFIAKKMGGNIIGQTIELKSYPGKKLTIAGIFKALPENTNYDYDILVSMVSIGEFMWDGRQNWLGNERYYTAVKLLPGVKPESLASAIRQMQEKHQDITKLEQQEGAGFVLKYTFEPINKIFAKNVKDMVLILSLIAFSVLFVSLMNYILLTLNSLVNRAKSSAIYKCYGAKAQHLQSIILIETLLVFSIALLLSLIMILILKPFVEGQVGHQLESVINPTVIYPLITLLVVIVLIIGYLPGRFYANIPVATAFRNYRQGKSRWKLGLLSLQFIGASFILVILVVVSMQYNKMLKADHGYNTENVFYGSTTGMEPHKIGTVLQELRNLPSIKAVSLGAEIPINGASGNNILSPDGKKELFNVADFYYIDDNYLSVLDIPILQGSSFSHETAATNDLLISKKGAEMLAMNNNWKDGVIGKSIEITEHGSSTIRGVYHDFVLESLASNDKRPSVFFYLPEEKIKQQIIKNPSSSYYILAKAKTGVKTGLMQSMEEIFNKALPHHDAVIKSLALEQVNNYQAQKGFHNAMKIGNIVIIIITIMGLLGYTSEEVNRRRKDLAIRKINGATIKDLLKMFIWDIERLAIPSVILGLLGAWYLSGLWMEQFAVKAHLSWGLFILICVSILIFIALIAVFNYLKTINKNPIESLRHE